jgi:oxepin-CoA hydrolase/3-oxo-5,6-dehydrosuberyl-CoA semialdehyde dehydrogenase
MTRVLRSYLCERWVEGSGARAQLVDPTTEAVLAEASTEGLDFRGALDHARRVGNPGLRELSFAARGQLLAAMASAIHEKREELVEVSIRNGGNTRGDAKFDVDGATGTLMAYAEIGKALGEARFLIDGEPVKLARSPRYVGRHVLMPLTGCAVHVNAFNFPAWGFAEKAAVALLAGMPVITKPATSTALLAERIVEILVEGKLLPPGALQLVSGPTGDLLDHLTGQDVLAFTGSATTGARLRGRRELVERSVRVGVEADSLNAAVLGPDVEPGTATWDLFARDVVKDMTQKAGQKCTAIRRVFVPEAQVAAARDDLAEQLRAVKVGDPSQKEVRMGPVCTADQLRDVRAGIERLRRAAEPVVGDGGRGTLVGVEGSRGWFVSPTLLFAPRPEEAADVHAHEVFGPCATLMPYGGTAAEAARLVRRGEGSLVSSVYSDDRDFVAEMVMGIAPYNGRLNLGSEKVAEHALGPGAVLPSLVHGGPGRAGGGEELGALRGLRFYLQRTALQGDEPALARILAHGRTCPDPAGPQQAATPMAR